MPRSPLCSQLPARRSALSKFENCDSIMSTSTERSVTHYRNISPGKQQDFVRGRNGTSGTCFNAEYQDFSVIRRCKKSIIETKIVKTSLQVTVSGIFIFIRETDPSYKLPTPQLDRTWKPCDSWWYGSQFRPIWDNRSTRCSRQRVR